MHDKTSSSTQPRPPLDTRFAGRPQVQARLHALADLMDKAIAQEASADAAEELVIQEIRRLGADVLTDYAAQKHAQCLQAALDQNPLASKHVKKKVTWLTAFGPVTVEEQLLRLGRRGPELRPFCTQAGVSPRGYSRRLQRILVDFGAENAFAPAARRVREHYGFDVPAGAVRQWTLRHGKGIAIMAQQSPARPGAQTVITQMDGSMVPIVQPGAGPDARRGKTVCWREARLCLARSLKDLAPIYGATLGTVAVAAWHWQECTRHAGVGGGRRRARGQSRWRYQPDRRGRHPGRKHDVEGAGHVRPRARDIAHVGRLSGPEIYRGAAGRSNARQSAGSRAGGRRRGVDRPDCGGHRQRSCRGAGRARARHADYARARNCRARVILAPEKRRGLPRRFFGC